MPWAAGSYTKGNDGTGGWLGDANNGVGIQATLHDNQDNDFTTGINSTLTKDGSNVPSANLPMGGFRHTGVGLATARDSYATLGQAQDGTAIWGGASGGTANAQTLTLSPPITAYAAGQRFRFVAGFTNTAAATLNVNGVGAVSVVLSSTGGALTSNYIEAGSIYEVLHNGTNFRLLGDPALIKRGDYENLGTSTGTANALVLTSTGPRLSTTSISKTFMFATNAANTGATTVAIDGLPAISVVNVKGNALRAADIQSGRFYQLLLNGSGSAILLGSSEEWQTWTPALDQSASVTYTNNEARFRIDGLNQVTCVFHLTATSAGTPSQIISVTNIPIGIAWSGTYTTIGSGLILVGANIYTCTISAAGGSTLRFFSGSGTVSNNVGVTPAITLAVGSQVSGTVTYRI